MDTKLSLLVLVCFFCATSQGLICWVCENELNEEGCSKNGTAQICPSHLGACQNEAVHGSFGTLITKRCKEPETCNTDFSKNIKPDWFPTKWNYRSPRSVCRCCCGTDLCNMKTDCASPEQPIGRDEIIRLLPSPGCEAPMNIENGMYICNSEADEFGSFPAETQCRYICNEGYLLDGGESATCTVIDKYTQQAGFLPLQVPTCSLGKCKKIDVVKNGAVECSNGNDVDSVCEFSCDPGYSLFSKESNATTCGTDFMWSGPDQCCLRDCSSNALMDLIIVLDSSYSIGRENWKRMLFFVGQIINNYEIHYKAGRIGVLTYSSMVDARRQINLNAHRWNKKNLIENVYRLVWLHEGTATGLALQHVRTKMFKPRMGDRKSAKNVVLVITDGKSNDTALVMRESRRLRAKGVITFAVGVKPENGEELDMQELNSIAGTSGQLKIVEKGFAGLDKSFADSLGSTLCHGRSCGISRNRRPTQRPKTTQPSPLTAWLSVNRGGQIQRDEILTTPSPPLCEPVKELLNGKINCNGEADEKGRFLIETDCTFDCDEGYDLEGGNVTNCVQKGSEAKFEDVSPFCRPRLCKAIGTIANGTVACDRGNEVNSVCQFNCTTGYHLYMHHITSAQCRVNQKWSNGNPCCLPNCEKNIKMDLIIVLDSSYSVGSSNWDLMLKFTNQIIDNYEIGDSAARIGVLPFSSSINFKNRIFLRKYKTDKSGLQKRVRSLRWMHQGTSTGEALKHVRKIMFSNWAGNRVDAQNVVLVITDGSSNNTPLVRRESRLLRSAGVVTYAIGVQPPNNGNLNIGELRLIGGTEDHVEIAEKGFADLNSKFAKQMALDLCKNRSCN